MINWDVTKKDAVLIEKIAKRASQLRKKHTGANGDEIEEAMNITACHANGTRLKLKELLDADDFNFSHDVCGIARHMDKATGTLTDFFEPRFSL